MIRTLRLIRNKGLTVANLLDELLPMRSDRLVSLGQDAAEPDGAPLTEQRFSDLHREVGAMSQFLVEEAGLRRGDRVAIFKTNDVVCFRWFLAVIRAGGIAVPLNPMLTLPEAAAIVTRCQISTVVTDRAVFQQTIGSRDALPVRNWVQDGGGAPLDGFLRMTAGRHQSPFSPPADVSPKDIVAIFHTSGTCGFPKGATLSSQALLAGRVFDLLLAPLAVARARALFPLPWAHIMAVSTALHGLIAGMPAYFLPRFEVQAAIAAIERYKLSVVVGVPAMFIRLVNASPSRESLSGVRLWVSGSDDLPVSYRRRLLRYGGLFVNVYGMVELGGVAMFSVDSRFRLSGGDVCFPAPPYRVRVADERGRATPPDEPGELQVHGPGVTGSYWGDTEDSPRSLTPDQWLRTGDVAVRNRLGLIRFAGRAKDVIKCGGYSVFPREVEEALSAHRAVLRAAVVGVPHAEKGEEPLAIVECLAGGRPSAEELLSWCRQRLAPYKAPRRVHILEPGSLPQGVTEKVLKRVLREQYGGEAVATGAEAP